MFILTDNTANNTVIYAHDELVFFDGGYHTAKTRYSEEIVSRHVVNDLPKYYEDNKFTYDADTGNFIYIKMTDEEKDNWKQIREIRNLLLQESDNSSYVIWPDKWASLSDIEKNAWLTYRQALRDIPKNYIHSSNVVWPVKPDFTPVDAHVGIIGSDNTANTP